MTLKDHQIAAIQKMLLFNVSNINSNINESSENDDQEITWKILIMDKFSTGIISSILRVNDLLKVGVTCHTTLFSPQRQPIPDIPAIYFVDPSRKNLEKIIQDLKNDFYDEYYLNFTSNISRENLEFLAKEAVKIGKFEQIKQVFDQYLNFVISDPNIFEFEMEKIWSNFNLNNLITEEEINGKCEEIASRLYSVIITLNSNINSLPILRIQPGGSAEIVGKLLETKLREYILSSKKFSDSSSNNANSIGDLDRSVLVLVDRNVDFASMISHSLYYECLIAEVFKLNRNTITLPNGSKIDLDNKDFFWKNNNLLPFPEVVENAELELNKYKQETEEITSKTGVNITNLQNLNVNKDGDIQQDTELIQKAMSKLPELTAKKQFIDNHFKILSELIKQLGSLHLDKFYELEQEDIYNIKTRNEFIETLKDTESGHLADKIRTYLYIFLKTNMNQLNANKRQEFQNFMDEYDSKLLDAIKNVYRYQKLHNMNYYTSEINNTAPQNGSNNTDTSDNGKSASYFSSKLYGLANDKLQDSMGSIISRVSNLLNSDNGNLPLTNIVSSIMNPSVEKKSEDELNMYEKLTRKYLDIDPTMKQNSTIVSSGNRRFNKCLCFVVGGGSYLEYHNLQKYIYSDKRIIYGSTKLISPNDFLDELANI
ncbi:Sec1-like protein [Hanseniaspora valbyensis NRRL Y-1626]|uniref:Sec1-like protein n=1 Tax=Hanseniaspora valbyensis NRRL Y-1626 TaxID=766949 RepID=A0A1B7T8T0_9ASCO|nr:Sec1-like protein [Hanseniaspora valbyensis NRRL Y-1626]